MILIWAARAQTDRRQIRQHIGRDNLEAAIGLDELVSRKAQLLLDNPHLGRPGRMPGTRELVVHPSYILIYDVTRDSVRILRVVHAARQWPPRRR